MRKPLRILILILIALRLLVLASCGKDYDWHQKLTVEVETPEGLKTASSVMSARLSDTHGPFVPAEANGVSFQLNGEAVALEVSRGRYLFVLLKSVPALNWLVYPKMESVKAGALLENGDDGGAGRVALKPDQYPLLGTFYDINNPASVKRVDPTNLEATFGPGYRLNGITLVLTKEPVARGKVEKLLGWWTRYADQAGRMISLRYPNKSPRGYDTLSPLDFWSLGNIPK
ncbi:hypothetical protein ABID16_004253 [Rhizobium aquaticum]|uniref:Lipoprotein n=1 Tax=Rhizobium aquaticum TaxID=1549636 RepID=A0ABV2J578_9HYPH